MVLAVRNRAGGYGAIFYFLQNVRLSKKPFCQGHNLTTIRSQDGLMGISKRIALEA